MAQGHKQLPKTAIYCRSAIENDRNIEKQLQTIKEYAKKYDIESYKTYVDNGRRTSPVLSRPAFCELVRDICSGQIKTVIVTDNHRLSRTGKLDILIERFLIENDVEHIEINQKCDVAYSDFKRGIIDKNKYLALLNLLNIEPEPDLISWRPNSKKKPADCTAGKI